jgi:peptidoglycan-associated lipoprotein
LLAKGYAERIPRILSKETSVLRNGKLYTFSSGITLTDDYIKTLRTVDEKEAAHQLNRRTEFSILRDDYIPEAKNDTLPIGVVSIINNPMENIVEFTIGANGVQLIPCIVNNVSFNMAIDDKAKNVTFSYEDAQVFLKEGRISRNDFKENEKAIDKDGNIVEKSTLIIKSIKLGNSIVKNIEAVVMKNMKISLIIDKPTLSKFGEITIDKDKKKLIIK